jgi:hypothetical protein
MNEKKVVAADWAALSTLFTFCTLVPFLIVTFSGKVPIRFWGKAVSPERHRREGGLIRSNGRRLNG